MFSVNDFCALMRSLGDPTAARIADLAGRHPDVMEPFMDKVEERLRQMGHLPAEAPADTVSPVVRAASPYLRELAEALDRGGSEGAWAKLRELIAKPKAHAALVAVVEG